MLGTHRAGRSRQARYGYAMISKFAPSITVSWVIRCAAWGHANTLHHFMSMFLSAQTESRQFSHGESYRKQLHPAYTIRVNGTRHNRSDFFFYHHGFGQKRTLALPPTPSIRCMQAPITIFSVHHNGQIRSLHTKFPVDQQPLAAPDSLINKRPDVQTHDARRTCGR